METKEHIFFIPLLLSSYVFVLVRKNNLYKNPLAKKLSIWINSLIILTSLSIDGAGAIISLGVKIAYTTVR